MDAWLCSYLYSLTEKTGIPDGKTLLLFYAKFTLFKRFTNPDQLRHKSRIYLNGIITYFLRYFLGCAIVTSQKKSKVCGQGLFLCSLDHK